MTKTELKARVRRALELLGELKDELDDIRSDAECAAEEIEPYEGRYDLTQAQEDRQAWLEELAECLSDGVDELDGRQAELEGLVG